jgi:hypothetical protein
MKMNFSVLGRFAAAVTLATTMVISAAQANDNNDFSHLDPQGIVSKRALNQAVAYFKKNRSDFSNQEVITIVDFTKRSNQKRMFIVDLSSGAVTARLTSHGRGSDPGNTGMANRFSNTNKSHMSSLGFYRTMGTYQGKHGYSLKLQGLSSTNSNALARAIVVHAANYVNESAPRSGRSHGCPALDPRFARKTIDTVKGGSLMYIWSGQ